MATDGLRRFVDLGIVVVRVARAVVFVVQSVLTCAWLVMCVLCGNAIS